MVISMFAGRRVMTWFRRGPVAGCPVIPVPVPVVAVPQARGSPDCRRQRNDTDRAEQDRSTCEGRHRLPAQTAIPNPAGAHHDIDLKEERAQVSAGHDLGLSGVRTDRSPRRAGQRPKDNGANVDQNPGGKHQCRCVDENNAGPHQLKQSNR